MRMVSYPAASSQVAIVESSSPRSKKFQNPPEGSTLTHTLWLWVYWPPEDGRSGGTAKGTGYPRFGELHALIGQEVLGVGHVVQVRGSHVVGEYEQDVRPGIHHLCEAPLCLIYSPSALRMSSVERRDESRMKVSLRHRSERKSMYKILAR